ncbi:MAG: hypothetical protein WCP30_03925 [Mycobacteriaceae bacterium]
MLKINRTLVASASIALACMGGAAVATSAVAAASGNVTATGGDGTAVDADGTQGAFTNSVQGTADDDGYQDALMTTAEEAKPQDKATPK